jgi:hypothetical protein
VSAGTLTRPAAPEIRKTARRPFLQGLKVRIKELAFEAKTIRREENKSKELSRDPFARMTRKGRTPSPEQMSEQDGYAAQHAADFWNLRNHRIGYVRPAARETLLAYAYLRGKAYRQVEASCKEPPNWDQVKRLVTKFGSAEWAEGLDIWRKLD